MHGTSGLPTGRPNRKFKSSRGSKRLHQLAGPLSLLLLAEVGLVAAVAVPAGANAAVEAQAPAPDNDRAAEAPDAASARLAAAVQDRQIEVLDARSENTTLWANPNGTMSLETHAGPVRFKKDGAWVDVDADLEKAPDGSVRAKAHPRGLKLAGRTGSAGGDLVTLGSGAQSVGLDWEGALPEPVLKGPKATYVNVRPGTDLVVEATRTGFEQYLVVKDRAAADKAESITLPLRTKGVNATQNADDSVTFTDSKTKKTVGKLPAPVMWDAAAGGKQGNEGAHRAPVDLKLAQQGDGLELQLTPDQKLLSDKDTKFPVTIDPSIFLGHNFDTTVRKGVTEDLSARTDLPIGFEYGKQEARSFLKFPRYDGIISGNKIVNAELNLFSVWSDSCEPRSWEVWDTGLASSATRWSTQPAWRGKVASSTKTLGHSADCSVGWVGADVTKLVQEWAKAGPERTEFGVGLRATDETDFKSYKIFSSADDVANAPSLLVTYEVPADPVKDHVVFWNDVLQATYRKVGGAPGPLARTGAMMHAAIYDAANSAKCAEGPAQCLGDPYLVKVPHSGGALPDINSAIDQAAYDVLSSVYPEVGYDKELADARSTIPAGITDAQRTAGSAMGQKAAAAMIKDRENDGATSNTAYTPSEAPGHWRPTGPESAATPGWGLVKPFGLTSGSQFRPAGPGGFGTMPELLKSPVYAQQVNDVKDLGKANSAQRTADQTEAALFTANDLNETYKPPGQLFEMTQIVSRDRNLSVTANAKLFALTAVSLADAGISAWDTKYRTEVDLWRPESAIRLDGDGNADTTVDPDWQPLSQDINGKHFSPPFPAYVSGHATFGGAWAKTMKEWFRTDDVTFTATTDDPNALGVTRTYNNFSTVAHEYAIGRVWLGVHYGWDGTEGIASGDKAAGFVTANEMTPNKAADWVKFEDMKNLGGCDALGKKLVEEHRWATYQCAKISDATADNVLYVK